MTAEPVTDHNHGGDMNGSRQPYRWVSNTLPNNGAGPWQNTPCPDCDGYENAHTATCPSLVPELPWTRCHDCLRYGHGSRLRRKVWVRVHRLIGCCRPGVRW